MKSTACLLGLVFSFAAAHAQEDRLPYVPCGTYDISHVDQHFAVAFSTQRLGDGMIEITIVTTAQAKDETKKQFPVKDLTLVYRNETGESLLETPLAWTKPRHPTWAGEQSTSFKISPDAARRAILQRLGLHHLPPHHSVMIGFRSLAKQSGAQAK